MMNQEQADLLRDITLCFSAILGWLNHQGMSPEEAAERHNEILGVVRRSLSTLGNYPPDELQQYYATIRELASAYEAGILKEKNGDN